MEFFSRLAKSPLDADRSKVEVHVTPLEGEDLSPSQSRSKDQMSCRVEPAVPHAGKDRCAQLPIDRWEATLARFGPSDNLRIRVVLGNEPMDLGSPKCLAKYPEDVSDPLRAEPIFDEFTP
jgi:hypothetical protein